MSKGILVFARNNSEIDYTKQALFLAKRSRNYLDLPVTVVTDSRDYLIENYPESLNIFDQIISEHDLMLDIPDHKKKVIREFSDGALVSKKLFWRNDIRCFAYDVSPYEETLLLDTDFVICNDNFLECFSQNKDFLIHKESVDLSEVDRGNLFERISDTSVDFYWATCVFFRKTSENEIFFDLVKHIQENWSYYSKIYQLNTPYFRNDYAFSIALHIMNGFQDSEFAGDFPEKLFFVTDKSLLWSIRGPELILLTEKPDYVGEYIGTRIKDVNLHVINKFSLNRCIDEQQ